MEGKLSFISGILLATAIMHPGRLPMFTHAMKDPMPPANAPGAAVASPVISALPAPTVTENADPAPTTRAPVAVLVQTQKAPDPEAAAGSTNGLGLGSCSDMYKKEIAEEAAFHYGDSGMSWDADPTWDCTIGRLQSPINVVTPKTAVPTVPDKFRVRIGQGSSDKAVLMVLPVLAVEMLGEFTMEGFQVPVCNATATPPDVGCFNAAPYDTPTMYNLTFKNIHFHSVSEHAFNGFLSPLEAHVVTRIPKSELSTCPPSGCLVVIGQTFAFGADNEHNAFLRTLIPSLRPLGKSCTSIKRRVNLTDLWSPDHSYTSYQGSLTTPPCTEGVTWVLLNTPVVVSSQQVRAFQNAMGSVQEHGMTGVRTNNRPIQRSNNRTMKYSASNDGKNVAPVR